MRCGGAGTPLLSPSALQPSQPWEHPALGCQLVPLQDPELGSITGWGSPPDPSEQDEGLFGAGSSFSMSTSVLGRSRPPRGPRTGWAVGTGGRAAHPDGLAWRGGEGLKWLQQGSNFLLA